MKLLKAASLVAMLFSSGLAHAAAPSCGLDVGQPTVSTEGAATMAYAVTVQMRGNMFGDLGCDRN